MGLMSELALLFHAYVAFVVLVFLGVAVLDLAPYVRKDCNDGFKRDSRYKPRTLVIVPCRGHDLTLRLNLRSIASQDYPNYDALVVVDSRKEPAYAYARELGINAIISEYKAKRSSGKVLAILTALKKFRKYDAYVIADSDITVKGNWLGELLKPLADRRIGISTSYAKFIPKGGFWSKVKSVWGLVGEGLMENRRTRFGWGGSLAFRRSLADRELIRMMENSRYSISDDICITRRAEQLGLGIAYVPGVQPEVASDESMGRFIEWANRQTALTILGYRMNLYYGLLFYSAEIMLFISGIALSIAVSPAFLILLLHLAKSEVKTYRRARSADPSIAVIVLFMPFLYLANLLAANGARYITWRGRRYAL